MSAVALKRGKKNKAQVEEKTKDAEPEPRKLTKIDEEDETKEKTMATTQLIEDEAEQVRADDVESEAETEIVPPSLDGDEYENTGYAIEAPLTSDEYLDGLLKAVDATKTFTEKYLPELKKQVDKVYRYKVPWYDEPTCTNERFCVDDGCDTSNRYPAWAWCLMRCGAESSVRIDGRVAVTFEPVARRVYVMFDCERFGKPIPLQCFDKFQSADGQAMDVNRVVLAVRKKLMQIAAHHGGLIDIDDA